MDQQKPEKGIALILYVLIWKKMNELEKHKEQFDLYSQELLKWNEMTNLTAITEPEEIKTKHFLDSLTVLDILPENTRTLIDIGSGAGFPGLPIKIARPDVSVTLIEAVGKKVDFLNHLIGKLELKNIQAIHTRAEEIGQLPEYREKYDVATARAVAELKILVEYALPLIKIGGVFIAQKILGTLEVEQAKNAIEILGGKIKEIRDASLPGLEFHQLVIIEKIKPTPEKYPRRSGMPTKKPL